MPETLTQLRARRLEANAKLLELAAEDDLDDDQTTEFTKLTGDVAKLTRREQAMVAAGADEPPEVIKEGKGAGGDKAAEFARLVAAADAGQIVDAVCFGRRLAGETAEVLAELKCDANVIPWALLAQPAEFAASTVTSAGDGSTKLPTIEQVFPTMVGDRFGVDRRMQPVGLATQPVVTAPTAGPTATAVGTAATDSAVTLGATNLSPDRLQVQAVIGRDEISTFTGLMGDVEMVLRDAIADGLDRRAVAEMFTAGTAPTTSSTVVTYAPGLAAVTAALDGRYAGSCKDLAVLVGPETGRLFETLYRSDESEVTLAMRLMDACEAYRISANVAAAASDDQEMLVARGAGAHVGVVQVIWGAGIEILDDPYSLSSEGQRRISACVMTDVEVVRAAVYHRASVHLA